MKKSLLALILGVVCQLAQADWHQCSTFGGPVIWMWPSETGLPWEYRGGVLTYFCWGPSWCEAGWANFTVNDLHYRVQDRAMVNAQFNQQTCGFEIGFDPDKIYLGTFDE